VVHQVFIQYTIDVVYQVGYITKDLKRAVIIESSSWSHRQLIRTISWLPKAHYCVRNSPPLNPYPEPAESNLPFPDLCLYDSFQFL
jgi:hypothetical protein